MEKNALIRKTLFWAEHVYGIHVSPVASEERINDPDMRTSLRQWRESDVRIAGRPHGVERKVWYDVVSNTLNVYIPNITDEQELDTLILTEVLSRKGLSAVLKTDELDALGETVYRNLREDVRADLDSTMLGASGGRNGAQAGRLYLNGCVQAILNARDPERKKKAASHWLYQMEKRVRVYNSPLWDSLVLDRFRIANLVARGLRSYQFGLTTAAQVARQNPSVESIRNRMMKMSMDEKEGRWMDRGSYILLGYPSDVLVSSSAWPRSLPVMLSLSALYGRIDDYGSRYARIDMDMKKEDRHPYDLLSIANLKKDVDQPLAVFRSRSSSVTSVVMAASRGGVNGATYGNFCIPVEPREVRDDKEKGRICERGTGQWVNYIKSIYPKDDQEYLNWLSIPSLTTYLSPDFEDAWLRPAVGRLQEAYEKKFKEEGMSVPSQREVERLMKDSPVHMVPQVWKKNIARPLNDEERAGLLSEYAAFKAAVESATKVVKDFENPIIMSRKKILYSISEEKDFRPGERVVMEALSERIRSAGVPVYIVSSNDPTLFKDGIQGERYVLGYTNGDEIFLSERGASLETLIHEYTHVWAEALKISDPELWTRIKDSLSASTEWEAVRTDPAYAGLRLNEDELASEVLAHLSGRRNAGRLSGVEAGQDFWRYVTGTILGQDEDLSIDAVTDAVFADLLKGTPLVSRRTERVQYDIGETTVTRKELQWLRKEYGRRSKASVSLEQGQSLGDVVAQAMQNGSLSNGDVLMVNMSVNGGVYTSFLTVDDSEEKLVTEKPDAPLFIEYPKMTLCVDNHGDTPDKHIVVAANDSGKNYGKEDFIGGFSMSLLTFPYIYSIPELEGGLRRLRSIMGIYEAASKRYEGREDKDERMAEVAVDIIDELVREGLAPADLAKADDDEKLAMLAGGLNLGYRDIANIVRNTKVPVEEGYQSLIKFDNTFREVIEGLGYITTAQGVFLRKNGLPGVSVESILSGEWEEEMEETYGLPARWSKEMDAAIEKRNKLIASAIIGAGSGVRRLSRPVAPYHMEDVKPLENVPAYFYPISYLNIAANGAIQVGHIVDGVSYTEPLVTYIDKIYRDIMSGDEPRLDEKYAEMESKADILASLMESFRVGLDINVGDVEEKALGVDTVELMEKTRSFIKDPEVGLSLLEKEWSAVIRHALEKLEGHHFAEFFSVPAVTEGGGRINAAESLILTLARIGENYGSNVWIGEEECKKLGYNPSDKGVACVHVGKDGSFSSERLFNLTAFPRTLDLVKRTVIGSHVEKEMLNDMLLDGNNMALYREAMERFQARTPGASVLASALATVYLGAMSMADVFVPEFSEEDRRSIEAFLVDDVTLDEIAQKRGQGVSVFSETIKTAIVCREIAREMHLESRVGQRCDAVREAYASMSDEEREQAERNAGEGMERNVDDGITF